MNSVNIVKGRTSFEPKMEGFSGFNSTFNVRLDEDEPCAGLDLEPPRMAPKNCYRGRRLSRKRPSWRELLGQLKRLGLSVVPKLGLFLHSAATIASGGRDR